MDRRNPKPSKQSKSRQLLHVPNKVLFISTFFNQRLDPYLQHHASLSRNNPETSPHRKPRHISLRTPPKYELNHHKLFLSFEETPTSKGKYVRLLRENTFQKGEKWGIPEGILQRIAVDKHKKVTPTHGSPILDSKKSALLGMDHQKIIKKQLQDKFQRTRMHLKEQEEKKEQAEKEVFHGSRRNPLIKMINKSQEIGRLLFDSQKFQPWIRPKLPRDDFFEEQGGMTEAIYY